jgi:hypothetical protein
MTVSQTTASRANPPPSTRPRRDRRTAIALASARPQARAWKRVPAWGRTTPQRLRLARATLILVTILTGLTGSVLVDSALQSVERVHSRTARALVATRQARASLADADRAAVHSFLGGDVLLGGPGQRYQDAVKAANQAVVQLAGTVGGDSSDSQRLQAIDAGLVTYVGLIEQADAAQRAEAAAGAAGTRRAGLGTAYLWYASRVLHEPGSGLLARVEQLGYDQGRILDARPWSLGAGALTTDVAVGAALLGCLVVVQVWMLRRFRRIASVRLAVATVCALVLCGWTVAGLVHVQRGYDSAEQTALEPLLGLWQVRSMATDADGQSGMAALQAAQCPAAAACRSAVGALGAAVTTAARTATASDAALPQLLRSSGGSSLARSLATATLVRDETTRGEIAKATADVQRGEPAFNEFDSGLVDRIQLVERSLATQLESAQEVPGLRVGIPVLSVVIMILASSGIGPRLEEYRVGGRGRA